MTSSNSRKRLSASVSNVMYTNAVYFPNSKIYSGATPGQMNYSCINHVYYAFAHVAADGSVFLSDEWADARAPCDGVHGGLGSLMHLKETHPHLRVVLSVGGGLSSETYPVVASDVLLRDNFARSARGLVEASGLDGIDVDWEYPVGRQQGADFVSLLASVRLYLPEDEYLLTAGLPAAPALLRATLDVAAAAQYLDFVNLKAYDLRAGHGTARRSGLLHHAQLFGFGGKDDADADDDEPSGSAGVGYLVAHGCAPPKILLGVPVYGRGFPGPGLRHQGAGDGTFEYRQLPRPHAKESVDLRLGAASCVGGDGGFVSYDTPETVRMKAAYCKQQGLGGLFYWTGPADSRDMSRSLIAAGFRALHSS
ncbi:glycoside hydrolase [Xylariomycetidae sp. FL0641]|nr:glycoside hydrolase [Xylariomycetidae sp. FL0641]